MAQGQLEVSGDQVIDNVFDVYETGGLGDCLFYSLGFALNNNTAVDAEMALAIRRDICERHDIMINEINAEFTSIGDQINPASSNGRMCNEGEWGEDVEIAKAARIYDIPIIVYMKDHYFGMYDGVVREYNMIDQIQNGTFCPQMQKYFVNEPFINVSTRLLSYYLPANSNGKEPILILNKGNSHYQILLPKGSYAGVQPASVNEQISKLKHQALALFESLTSGAPEDDIIEQAKESMPQKLIDAVFAQWKKLSTSSGSYTGVQPASESSSSGASLSNLASLSTSSGSYTSVQPASESSSSGASLSNLAALSLPQVAQPILSKPVPTVKDFKELMALLETVRGNVNKINRIVREAESEMQIPEEIIKKLFNMFKQS